MFIFALMKKFIKYICRSWEDEKAGYVHPALKIFPPFAWEVLSYLVALAIAVSIIKAVYCHYFDCDEAVSNNYSTTYELIKTYVVL